MQQAWHTNVKKVSFKKQTALLAPVTVFGLTRLRLDSYNLS